MNSAECRACTEDDKMLEHYLWECRVFSQLRQNIFHGFQCSMLRDIRQVGWKKLGLFTKSTELMDKA